MRAIPYMLACLAVCLPPAAAIDPARAFSQYVREKWGPESGFPHGSVYAITQTADGYLWIGSEDGLIRFDGLSFVKMAERPESGGRSPVLGLVPAGPSSLWIQILGPTILHYRGGQLEDLPAGAGATAMCRSKENGLLMFSQEKGVVSYSDGLVNLLAPAAKLPRSPIIAMAQTADGGIWLGSRDAGLFRLHNGAVLNVSDGLPDPKVNCLLADGHGDLWVGTDNGVVRWNQARLEPVPLGQSGRRLQVLSLARDRDDNLWVGTNPNGLLRHNRRGVTSLNPPGAGAQQAVTAVFEDREGNLWIGRASGVERIRDSAFVTYSQLEGVPSSGNHPLFIDETNRLWFPHSEGGLAWWRDGVTGRFAPTGLDRDVIYSISGRAGELWLGRQNGGLTGLRPKESGSQLVTYAAKDGLAQDSVYSVYQAQDGSVWAGTLSGGASHLKSGRFTNYTTGNGLASNTIASIVETSEGAVWFATPNGLSRLKSGKWQTYSDANGLPSGNVNCLLLDASGVLWAGTAAGLAYFDGNGFVTGREVPAVMREPVLGLADDRAGSLWIATSNHIIQVKRDKLLKGPLLESDVREYSLADGLRDSGGVKRHKSVALDSIGRIWFSTRQGISVVDPGRIRGMSAPALVHIQSVSADGTPVTLATPVRIPGGSRRITIRFAGLGLSIPERVRYRYRLEEFDRDWSQPVAAREAEYTNLGPGSYRFRVLSSNPDGEWSSQEASLAFEIQPLSHQSWWFRTTAALLIVLGAIAFYRLRLRQTTAQLNVRFDERLAERTRLAQDLHDTLLQGFLSASMQLHVASDSLPESSPAKRPVERVLQLMGQVIEEGRNAVRGLRTSSPALPDLAQSFTQIRQEFPNGDDVEFHVIVDGPLRPMHPVLRDEVYRIGREALVNAFRHSRAARIEMELEFGPRRFRFLVRDNGCGIDSGVIRSGREGHWGLLGMRERAERIGGHLRLWSSSEAGTEVELSVPGRVAYQPDLAERPWVWVRGLFERHQRGKQNEHS